MSILVQIRHAVARKNTEYIEKGDTPNYREFSHCRVCKRNHPKEIVLCPRCKYRVSHGARDKKRWPKVYNIHRH